jgi:hypothetical protein
MKTATVIALVVIAVGAYIEYQKDSSFASTDSGSLVMGAGVGLLVGNLL